MGIDRQTLLFFDGLGWTRDYYQAAQFATLGRAALETDREAPTHHPVEVWRDNGLTIDLHCSGALRRDDLPRTRKVSEYV